MNSTQLREQLLDSIGCVLVDEISTGSFVVEVPNLRFEHWATTLHVMITGDVWRISDLGTLANDFPNEVEPLVESLRDAGAPFELDGEDVIFELRNTDALSSAIRSFCYYLSSAPAVWHALEAAKSTAPPQPVCGEIRNGGVA